jgi:hypothetical protein
MLLKFKFLNLQPLKRFNCHPQIVIIFFTIKQCKETTLLISKVLELQFIAYDHILDCGTVDIEEKDNSWINLV